VVKRRILEAGPDEKRQTVPNTLHGTLNQVHQSMYHAFVLAYDRNIDFRLRTESIPLGDFDDLIIITAENITAIQYKHTLNPDNEIRLNDLITKNGGNKELMLHKYFKSLQEHRPGWQDEDYLELRLASNASLSESLAGYIDPHTHKFRKELFSAKDGEFAVKRKILVASILKHACDPAVSRKPISAESYIKFFEFLLGHQQYFPEAMIGKLYSAFPPGKRGSDKVSHLREQIKKYSSRPKSFQVTGNLFSFLECNASPHSGITYDDLLVIDECPEEKKAILRFLRRLSIDSAIPNDQETIATIKDMLEEIFHCGVDGTTVLYDACFIYFLEWLGSHEAIELSRDEIKDQFTTWHGRYIDLQRWIGVSTAYRQSISGAICGRYFEREDEIGHLKRFESSRKKALILSGERGMGKSALARAYMVVRRDVSQSDYLLLNLDVIMTSLAEPLLERRISFRYFNACRIIIIDNCENLSSYAESEIKKFHDLVQNTPRKVKFCFIIKSNMQNEPGETFGIPREKLTRLSIKPLNRIDIQRQFPEVNSLSGSQLTLFKKMDAPPLVSDYLGRPFYLNLLMMYFQRKQNFHVDFSSTDNFIDSIVSVILTREEFALLRQLIYLLSKKQGTQMLSARGKLDNLVALNIVTMSSEGQYQFSHRLYEEWVLRLVVEQRVTQMIEANDSFPQLYTDLERVLPDHKREWLIYIGDHTPLNEHLKLMDEENRESMWMRNNNLYYLFILLKLKEYRIIRNSRQLFYLLVDCVPVELLYFFLKIVSDRNTSFNLLGGSEFGDFVNVILVRCLCLSEDLMKTGFLFHSILHKIDNRFTTGKRAHSYFMERFFTSVFATCYSVGIMSHGAKLEFLRHHVRSEESREDLHYFQYIYHGLLKAAQDESGDSSYPEIASFFSEDGGYLYLDGYVNFKGEERWFKGENTFSYHVESARLLIEGYNHFNEDNLFELRDILSIFETNLNAVGGALAEDGYIDNLHIKDVASLIASTINMDAELHSEMSEKLKMEKDKNNMEADEFLEKIKEPRSSLHSYKKPELIHQLLHHQHERVEVILAWRATNDFKPYPLALTNGELLIDETVVNPEALGKPITVSQREEAMSQPFILSPSTSTYNPSSSPSPFPSSSINRDGGLSSSFDNKFPVPSSSSYSR